MTPKHIEEKLEIEEYGSLHNEDCCVNFPEDSRACDVGLKYAECCEHMQTIKHLLTSAYLLGQDSVREEVEKTIYGSTSADATLSEQIYQKSRKETVLEILSNISKLQDKNKNK